MDPTTAVRLLIQRTISALPELITRWGLHPEAAVRYSLLREYMIMTNRKAPSIISGYRSPAKQRCLLENWNAGYALNGNCSMPVSKPACRSWHMFNVAGVPASLAFDLSFNAPDIDVFRQLWNQLPYSVSGTSFGDPNHFHVELPLHRPPSICN